MQRLAALVFVVALVLAPAAGARRAEPAGGGAPRTPVQVVRAWSRALNASDDRAAGALFAPGALAIQGAFVVRLRTARSAVLWNSGLPCGGTIVSLQVQGNVVTATFALRHREGHTCDGPGQLAAARFTVKRGRITRWEQVPPGVSGPVA